MGNTTPNPYNKTFARAGISCVVVTRIFTQFVLWNRKQKTEISFLTNQSKTRKILSLPSEPFTIIIDTSQRKLLLSALQESKVQNIMVRSEQGMKRRSPIAALCPRDQETSSKSRANILTFCNYPVHTHLE